MRTLFVVVTVMVAVGGCRRGETAAAGEATSGGEGAARIADLRSALPPGAYGLVRADVQSLRASPHADRVIGMLRPWLTGGEGSSHDLAEELLSRTALVYVASYAEPAGMVGVARGSYDPGFVENVLREEAGRRGRELRVDEVQGHRVLRVERGSAVELQNDTWLFGTEAAVDGALAVLRTHRNEPLLVSPETQAMAERVRLESAVLAGVSEARSEIRDRLATETPLRSETVEGLEVLGMQLDLARGVRVEVLGGCRDEASAGRLRDDLSRLVRNAGSNPFVAIAGFDVLFRATQVNTEGRSAVLETSLTDAQAQDLLARLDAILATMSSAMKSNVAAPPSR